MSCPIFKFNELRNNVDTSNNKTSLCLHIPNNLNFNYYSNIVEIGFIYRNSSKWCCLFNNIYNSPIEKQDFKILVRNNIILLLYHGYNNINYILMNSYYNYSFVDGNYYVLRLVLNTNLGIINLYIDGTLIASSGYYPTISGTIHNNLILSNMLISHFFINRYISINDYGKIFIGDGALLYNLFESLYPSKDITYECISDNVGNCSICYLRLYIDNGSGIVNLLECYFKNSPNYSIDDVFSLQTYYFELLNSYTNDLDNTWNDNDKEPLCCIDCNYKQIISLENIKATDDKSFLALFQLDTESNVIFNNNTPLSCDGIYIFYILNNIFNYFYNNNYNYFIYYIQDPISNCITLRIKINDCNLKVVFEGNNILFDIRYRNIEDCCPVEEENDCCINTYKIDKNYLYLEKYYTNIIIDDIKLLYKKKSLYDRNIYSTYKKLLLYNSLMYLRYIESNYCINSFDIKKYLKEVGCNIKGSDYICLYENISDMKNCCDDREFDLLCRCKDEYPNEFKDIDYYIDINSSYPLGGYNILSLVNEGLLEYRCCDDSDLDFIGIENNEVTHLTLNYNFVLVSRQFSLFNLVGPPTVPDTPKKESFELVFKYCNKYTVKKKVNIHYYNSCKNQLKPNDDYHVINYSPSININSINIVSVTYTMPYTFINCCKINPNLVPINTLEGYEIITIDNVIKITNISVGLLWNNLIINYTINPTNIKNSDLVDLGNCNFIYKKIIKVKLKECGIEYEHEFEFNIPLYSNDTNDISINTSSIPSIIIHNNNSNTGVLAKIYLCSKKCCNGLCSSTILLPDYNSSLLSSDITLYHFNSLNVLVSVSGISVTAYNKQTMLPNDECECREEIGIVLNLDRDSNNNLTQFPSLPNGLHPIYFKVLIKKCDGSEEIQYINIFNIQK